MGYVPSGSRPPRGYKVEFEEVEIEGRRRKVRRWVEDPELWPLVRRAWEMKLAGMSHRRILEETGLYKSPGCLTTFFRNPSYKGELVFGGTVIRVPVVLGCPDIVPEPCRGPFRGPLLPDCCIGSALVPAIPWS
jgi:hypothetical protein